MPEPSVPSSPASVPAPPGGGGKVPAPAAPAIPPSDNRIVGIEEAPESVRAAIQKVGISGHIWSEDPALRLLTVQNRIVRQGADVAPGVRVEEITPDGAVLVSGGWRVRVAGF
jgi:general secretion pathway protein B